MVANNYISDLDPSWYLLAGLGLFNQKGARALAPRGLLRSAYDFLCLIYTKCSRASWTGQFRPTLEATRKKRFWAPQRGFGDTFLYTKNRSKTTSVG
jgi:hypothetical protein